MPTYQLSFPGQATFHRVRTVGEQEINVGSLTLNLGFLVWSMAEKDMADTLLVQGISYH
jgi:hypothetical protein